MPRWFWLISYINYSIFLHLAYAWDHLSLPLNSSFSEFYTHLGSICDLAEDFLLAVHLCVSECRDQPGPVLQGLPREEFLKMAAEWYDEKYPMAYEHYHKKGKPTSLRLPPRQTILCEYFDPEDPNWNAYKKFSDEIRPYRNKVVHDVAMGILLVGKFHLVPRKERMANYGAIRPVQAAAKDIKRLKRDFIVREEQMFSDFRTIQECLNELWEKPTGDLRKLLYGERNPVLLQKYNLELA
jgi:hypothetical protein